VYFFKVGDFVSRKSYGEDVYFTIEKIDLVRRLPPIYTLRGVTHRLLADATADDLVPVNHEKVNERVSRIAAGTDRRHVQARFTQIFPSLLKIRARPGSILHFDGDKDFLKRCEAFYGKSNLKYYGYAAEESKQPELVERLLKKHKPDILVVTGHDAMKKKTSSEDSVDNYRNSRYFIESVKIARNYEPDFDKLCIFAGACQSYYEGIMAAGANFASSPGRILINALDPAIVSEKVALTDSRKFVTPEQVGQITESGSKGVSGINTRGRLTWG